jgi:hypothetical protein
MVNHRALTAALVDSRDDLSAKQRAETLPPIRNSCGLKG